MQVVLEGMVVRTKCISRSRSKVKAVQAQVVLDDIMIVAQVVAG